MFKMNAKHRTDSRLRILGLMTGSSADGLDICLVEFLGEGSKPEFEVCYSSEIRYPAIFCEAFRNPLLLSENEIRSYDQELGQWFAVQLSKLNLNFDIIASHGQTIKHDPPDYTLQIGDPKYMATQFKVPVVYNFRSADLREGGQGAPLIPIVDKFLFQQNTMDTLCLNIGGIANITMVPSANSDLPILAWDTGPGNTLIDKAVRLYSSNELAFDPDGTLAARGRLNIKLLDYLLGHEFYSITPPRSAGQEQFGLDYFNNILEIFSPSNEHEFYDLIFTLTLLSAKMIASSVLSLNDNYSPSTIHISGGGVHNQTLINLLRIELPEYKLILVNKAGVTESNKEAFGFAYLGYCFLKNIPGNVRTVTGAQHEVVLGQVCQIKK